MEVEWACTLLELDGICDGFMMQAMHIRLDLRASWTVVTCIYFWITELTVAICI